MLQFMQQPFILASRGLLQQDDKGIWRDDNGDPWDVALLDDRIIVSREGRPPVTVMLD